MIFRFAKPPAKKRGKKSRRPGQMNFILIYKAAALPEEILFWPQDRGLCFAPAARRQRKNLFVP
jgi:hypothetical protein